MIQDRTAEEALMGALLMWPRRTLRAADLDQDDFSTPLFAAVWRDARAIADQGERPDLAALGMDPERMTQLADLMARASTVESVPAHARKVRDAADRRRIIRACEKATRGARDGDGMESVIEGLRESMRQTKGQGAPVTPISETVAEVVEWTQERTVADRAGKTLDVIGVPTGFSGLDDPEDGLLVFGGLPLGQVSALVADTSVGKSSLAIDFERNLALNNAIEQRGVLDCTLEDSRYSRVKRMLTHISMIGHRAVQNGIIPREHEQEFMHAAGELAEANIFHMDRQARTVERMCRQAVRHCEDEGTALWVVDYLQLLRTERKFRDRNERAEYVMDCIIDAAFSLPKTATLVVSTLRSGDYSKEMPTVEDIPYSKQQKYDLYTLMALWRPSKAQALPCCWLQILKQKEGRKGGCALGWHEATASFHNLDSPTFNEMLRRGGTDRHNLRDRYENAIGLSQS
jgi:replicative DNA helicase